MNRRDFLKGVVALCALLLPSRLRATPVEQAAAAPPPPPPIPPGNRGVLYWGKIGEPLPQVGLLVYDFVATRGRPGCPRRQVDGVLGRVVGPSVIVRRFYEDLGDVTKAGDNRVVIRLRDVADNPLDDVEIHHVVLTTVGVTIQAGDITVIGDGIRDAVHFFGLDPDVPEEPYVVTTDAGVAIATDRKTLLRGLRADF